MITVAIIGGRLQGVEAAYLAAKAGMKTVLIDRREDIPARYLCNRFICSDVANKEPELIRELKNVDFILPALENGKALKAITEIAGENNLALAFDLTAYSISSSKKLSDRLMLSNGIPAPKYYPDCKAPFIVKPSGESGSSGVRCFDQATALENFLRGASGDTEWVAQEFLSGRSYSIEIIGRPGYYRTYEVTEIFVDEAYDCKRVTAPVNISPELEGEFGNIALQMANILKLTGIMDVEVIDDRGILKVLEIDARLPSQTPTVVYHSTGVNMVEELFDLFCKGSFSPRPQNRNKQVSYEHFLINNGQITAQGEHVMGCVGPLTLKQGFCGADEVLTNYKPGCKSWRGTFINVADSQAELAAKRENMFKAIDRLQEEALEFIDLSPIWR